MVFELLEKRGVGRLYNDEISIRKGHITFGMPDFFNKDYVEIYVNRKEKLIGFMPSSDYIRGFKVGYKGDNCNTINHSNGFLRGLIGRYIGKKSGKMFVITVDKLK